MNNLIFSIARTIIIALEYLMLFRAIMSWIPQLQGTTIQQFIYQLTEPILAPFRNLLNRLFPALQRFPIDISFMVAYFVLLLIERMLYI